MESINKFIHRTQPNNTVISGKAPVTENNNSNNLPNQPEAVDKKNPNELNDIFVKAKKNNGLFQKFYNFVKNKTGLGLGSDKIKQNIKKAEEGLVSEDEVKTQISDYKISQENAAQNFGDLASSAVGFSIFYKLTNFVKKSKARLEADSINEGLRLVMDESKKFKEKIEQQEGKIINKIEEATKEESKEKIPFTKRTVKKLLKKTGEKAKDMFSKCNEKDLLNTFGSNKTKAKILFTAMFAAGVTKWALLKLNRIGSKEFKVENPKQLDKKERKKIKKELNRKRHKENFKNFCTGAVNGLLAPVAMLVGGFAGAPAFLAATTGLRYLTSNNDNKEKSLGDFTRNFKNNIALNSVFALAIGGLAFKKGNYSSVLSKNLEKVVKNMKEFKRLPSEFEKEDGAYRELENLLLGSEKIKNILSDKSLSVEESIHKLTDENIFAVKFLQIGDKGEISSRLIENCPTTRTIEEAQQEINKLLNKDNYAVSRLLGVGTVAESYLAKDQSGKEVCIKILKKGINAEKIQKDKDAFIKLVTKEAPKDQFEKAQQEYLIRNIENLANAYSQEVDFVHEMEAANKLRKYTKTAHVVVPIEAKQGVYIMEKAPGISLYDLNNTSYLDDIDLSKNEIMKILNKYIDVSIEQLYEIEKNGKTLHADIHPGNIFIDIDALKSKKGNIFTLIDTGNTIDLTKEQSAAAVRLTSYIKKGNFKDMAKYFVDGAILPEGMTQKEADNILERGLRKIFTDKEIAIKQITTDEVFKYTENIMRKNHIVPNDAQLNLHKAKKATQKSFLSLSKSMFDKKYKGTKIQSEKDFETLFKDVAKDIAMLGVKYKTAMSAQESRNLLKMSPKEQFKYFFGKNGLKSNSEEYLTYKFKQDMQQANEF